MANNGLFTFTWLLGGLALGMGIMLYMSSYAQAGTTEKIRRKRRRALVNVSMLLGLVVLALLALDRPAPGHPAGSNFTPGNLRPEAQNLEATRASSLWLFFANLVGPGSVAVWLYVHMRAARTEAVRRRRALAIGVFALSDVLAMVALINKIWS